MSRMRRSTNPPTVHRKKTVTVPETRAASSHLNVQTSKRTQNSSRTRSILNVLICCMDTLTIRIESWVFSCDFDENGFNVYPFIFSKCCINLPYPNKLDTNFLESNVEV